MKNFIILSIISLLLIGCQEELSKKFYSHGSELYYHDNDKLYYIYDDEKVLVTNEINPEEVFSYEKVKTYTKDLQNINVDIKFDVKLKHFSSSNIFYRINIRYMKSEDGPEKFEDSETYSKLQSYTESKNYPFTISFLDDNYFEMYSLDINSSSWSRVVDGDELLGYEVNGKINDLSNLYFKEIDQIQASHRIFN